MCKFTSRSPIFDATITHHSAVKKRIFSHIFHSTLIDFHCIANQRAGGESTHNFAYFLYKLPCRVINCQTLNCPGSFDGVCQEKYGYSIWNSAVAKVTLT